MQQQELVNEQLFQNEFKLDRCSSTSTATEDELSSAS